MTFRGTGYTIYKHTNRINGKVYIGLTSEEYLTDRWQNGRGYKGCRYMGAAVKKYGWDAFDHEILETGLTKEEADAAEKRYIAEYHARDPKFGYNIQEGGHDAHEFSPEGLARLKELFSGANANTARAVAVFDLSGKRVADFDTATEAAKFIGVKTPAIVNSCSRGKGTCNGYICHYTENVEGINQLPPSMIYKPNAQTKQQIPVVMYGLDGHYIRFFDGTPEASEYAHVPCNQISCCLTGKQKTAGGYMWRYCEDDIPLFIEPYDMETTRHTRAVCQYDMKSGDYIAAFESITEAARETGVTLPNISKCLNGNSASAGGFIWRYKSENLKSVSSHDPHWSGKFVNKAVIKCDKNTGEELQMFASVEEAAKDCGVSGSSISFCLTGKSKTSCGYTWKYA